MYRDTFTVLDNDNSQLFVVFSVFFITAKMHPLNCITYYIPLIVSSVFELNLDLTEEKFPPFPFFL